MKRLPIVQGLAGLALLGLGLAVGLMWSEYLRAGWRERLAAGRAGSEAPTGSGLPGPSAKGTGAAGQPDEPVEIALAPDVLARAGIKTATVRSGSAGMMVSVPGTVTSNAYRDTRINALVSGIIRHVSAELGAPVSANQSLAILVSAELADAQMKLLSARAMLEADHQKRERTEKLVALGAASRQELEEVRAIHATHETEAAAARQRLMVFGLDEERIARLTDPAQVVSEIVVSAPAEGIIVGRSVNPGQVVGAGQELFVVTDLRTVWIVGDVYEQDVPRVAVGAEAVITVPAAPARPLRGRVSYIDPRVDPGTRTAKVRVEMANPGRALRPGMFVSVAFQASSRERVTLVPSQAVQAVGERAVVYVPLEGGDGRFAERVVKLGPAVGDQVQVIDGLRPGERVVIEGSFLLRAEAARTRPGG